MNKKKIVFLTGTRADFGKLKSLIKISQESDEYEVHIFATGMHMNSLYGATVDEIYKSGFKNIYQYINHETIEYMDRTLAKTIDGFSHYIAEVKPDIIVVHGDRLEAMAGAIVGSFNNILVAHIEGGEISGTIDESIRHSVTKLAHIHLVANEEAKTRLIQLGEFEDSIFVLGSPDLDLMNPSNLPSLNSVKEYYDIEFEEFSIAIFHPITTEYDKITQHVKEFVDSLIESNLNYIVIYPNNDLGSIEILSEYKRFENNRRFKIFPSLRFEYFLKLLKNSNFIIGNSSAGIREAPFYNITTIDIGSRQNGRVILPSILHTDYDKTIILKAIEKAVNKTNKDDNKYLFGKGHSDKLFLDLLNSKELWLTSHQKQFQELQKNE
ncbi:MAG: UDP-N-acetylglucosamine 2-epimerase (hydrolyzing) [Sulfurimonas sp.]|nr:MAG: UDP-N-acetylglucosamine 2-epimerase (hydrolyzing) [Sulfurimonas sp.]